ncbi:tectonic-3-like isoform X2 [Denticeps clupeoides]|uniref:tectonic-3-like isoform X2 n=1 Tax=Denticeps clupeoides TaxID=299321 RepID=UPI0010A40F87|nr:tectonic-3-like isoform X2 [Denticeps clupeoides]
MEHREYPLLVLVLVVAVNASVSNRTANATDGNFTNPAVDTGTPSAPPAPDPTPSAGPTSSDFTTTDGTAPTPDPTLCWCDLTPGLCDIGCCCDVVDCGVLDPSTVFNSCGGESRSGSCIESWLMFRANVDPALITDTEGLFCVQSEEGSQQQNLRVLSDQPKRLDSPHFSLQEPAAFSIPSRDFYKVDDVLLIRYSGLSVLSVLKQPAPGPATFSCVDRNPARFLRSGSTLCSRALTAESCGLDLGLRARSYFSNISLLGIPKPQKMNMTDKLVSVIPVMEWPEPRQKEGSCLNIVSKVEYIIEYTSRGQITMVTVNVTLTDAVIGTRILQQHAVQFQLATASPTAVPRASVGLMSGAPVIGRFGEELKPASCRLWVRLKVESALWISLAALPYFSS